MSSMLASDANNPQFVGAHNPDDVLNVTFFKNAVQNPFETSRQGRPIFNDMIYIRIITPGIPELNRIERPMREADKVRFSRQWQAFNAAVGDIVTTSGTPVDQWAFLTRAQAEELKAAKFYTVEMIANSSDQQIGSLGMVAGMAPLALRERARAHIKAATGSADTEHTATQLADAQRQIADMQKQIAALANGQKPRGKPGRKPRPPIADRVPGIPPDPPAEVIEE